MKIGVLVKQVPDTESRIVPSADGGALALEGVKWVINPFDEYAIEEAIRFKEKFGGEVVIVTLGPKRSAEAMRQAMAMGADRGVRIDTENIHDGYTTACALAKVCERECFDIIFAGKQAVDDDLGQVMIGVAECLGFPHVSPIEGFEAMADGKIVKVIRPIGGGIKEVLEISLPAVVGCEKGLNSPRYPSLPNIMKAKSKPIVDVALADVVESAESNVSIVSWETEKERAKGRMIEGEPVVAAKELVRILREEAKVI